MPPDDRFAAWLEALEARYLADLTPSEVGRALRALSSCYVERRAKLPGALDTAGKRAAFGLFYAPLHFLVTREVVSAIPDASTNLTSILDLGCGTGAAGAAWAIDSNASRLAGIDRHPWAASEANWTYRQLALPGRATRGDVARAHLHGAPGQAILAAYTINELPEDTRAALLPRLLDARRHGARLLIIEPIARTLGKWWPSWERTWLAEGGRSDEWRFPVTLPARQRHLGRAAGLDPRELTARSLWLPSIPNR